MENKAYVIQFTRMTGLLQRLLGEVGLEWNNLACNTYFMNTKLKTISGQHLINIKTYVDTQAVNSQYLDIQKLILL